MRVCGRDREPGGDYFERRRDPDREAKRLIAQLQRLGHNVTPGASDLEAGRCLTPTLFPISRHCYELMGVVFCTAEAPEVKVFSQRLKHFICCKV